MLQRKMAPPGTVAKSSAIHTEPEDPAPSLLSSAVEVPRIRISPWAVCWLQEACVHQRLQGQSLLSRP